MIVPHNELRIHQNVPGEDQRTHDAVAELEAGRVREEGRHEAEKDDDPQGAEEVGLPGCEVVFRLAGEEGEDEEDAEGEDQGFDDDAGVVELGIHLVSFESRLGGGVWDGLTLVMTLMLYASNPVNPAKKTRFVG